MEEFISKGRKVRIQRLFILSTLEAFAKGKSGIDIISIKDDLLLSKTEFNDLEEEIKGVLSDTDYEKLNLHFNK